MACSKQISIAQTGITTPAVSTDFVIVQQLNRKQKKILNQIFDEKINFCMFTLRQLYVLLYAIENPHTSDGLPIKETILALAKIFPDLSSRCSLSRPFLQELSIAFPDADALDWTYVDDSDVPENEKREFLRHARNTGHLSVNRFLVLCCAYRPKPETPQIAQGSQTPLPMRMIVQLHQNSCIAGGARHTYEQCHFNPRAKHIKWCYPCFGHRKPNRIATLVDPMNPPDESDQIAQGLFDTKLGVDNPTLSALDVLMDRLEALATRTTDSLDSTATNVTDEISQQITALREEVAKIANNGLSVKHEFNFFSRAQNDEERASFAWGDLFKCLPSLLSLFVILLSDLPITSKLILIVPPLQVLLTNVDVESVIEKIREFFSNQVSQGPFVFSSAASLFHVFSSMFSLPTTKKEGDDFLRRFDLLPKAIRGSSELFTYLVKFTKYFVNWASAKLGYESPFADDVMKLIEPWITNAEELIAVKPSVETFNAKHVIKLFNSYEAGLKLQTELSKMRVPQSYMQIVSSRLAALKSLTSSLSHLAYLAGPRVEPLFLYLWGGSGVGKSGSINLIQIDVAKFDKDMDPAKWVNNIYLRMPEQEYHDGATNDSLIEYYDDFGQIHDTVNTPDPSLLEIIRLGNIVPYPRHMADVQDKGKIFAQPRLVMMTSNREKPDIQSLTHPEAFERRINMRFEVRLDPAVVKDRSNNPCTLMEYNRIRFEDDPGAIPLDKNIYRFVGTLHGKRLDLNYREFISVLLREYRANLNRTHDMKAFYDNYAAEPLDVDEFVMNGVPTAQQAQGPHISELQSELILKIAKSLDAEGNPPSVEQMSKWTATIFSLSALALPTGDKIELPYNLSFITREQVRRLHVDLAARTINGEKFDPKKNSPIVIRDEEVTIDLQARCIAYHLVKRFEAGKTPDIIGSLENQGINLKELYKSFHDPARLLSRLTSFTIGHFKSMMLIQTIATHIMRNPGIMSTFAQHAGVASVSSLENAHATLAAHIMECRNYMISMGMNLETYLRSKGFKKAVRFGNIIRAVYPTEPDESQTDAVTKALQEYIQTLELEEITCLMQAICDLHNSISFGAPQFDTPWKEFKRKATRGFWGLMDKFYVNHPMLAILCSFVFIVKTFSTFQTLAYSVFESVSSAFNSGQNIPDQFSESRLYSGRPGRKVQRAEDQGSEGALYPGSRTGAKKRQLAEGLTDVNADQLISHRIILNQRTLSVQLPSGKSCDVHGIMIRGRCFLTYHHGLDVLLSTAKACKNLTLKDVRNQTLYNLDPHELVVVRHQTPDSKDMDLAIVELPRMVAPGKDLVPALISASDFHKLEGAEVTLVTPARGRDFAPKYRISSCETVTNAVYYLGSLDGEPVNLTQAIKLRAETDTGDCGSVVVSLNPTLSQKLCGLHVSGGADGTTRAIPITFERVSKMLSRVSQSAQMFSAPTPEEDPYVAENLEPSVQNHVSLAGIFQKEADLSRPVSVGTSSCLYPSPITGCLIDSKVKPAHLRPRMVNDELVRPMEKSLSKAGKLLPHIDADVLKECVDDVTRLILNNSDREPRLLTIEEAVHGVEGDTYLKSLSVSTSPGYPYSQQREKGKRGKTTWITHADPSMETDPNISDKLREDAQRILNLASQGIRTPVLYLDFPKDETRPIAKVEAMKTRSVNCSPLPYTVACKIAFGSFVAAQMDGRCFNGSAIGVNPYSYDWQDIAANLQEVGDCMIAGDYGGWDGGMSTDLLWAAFDIINGWYGDDGNEIMRRTLFEDIATSTHVHGSEIYSWLHSMPSGTYLTACVNTLMNNLLVRLCWMDSFKGSHMASMSHFNRHVRTIALGDDHVISVSPQVASQFNQRHMTVFAESLCMEYTDEQKSKKEHTTRPLSQVTFLKRGFYYDSEYGRYVGRLDYETILEMVNWLRKGLPTSIALNLNIECALRELSLYDKATYDFIHMKVVAAMRKAGLKIPAFPSYNSNRLLTLEKETWIYSDLVGW